MNAILKYELSWDINVTKTVWVHKGAKVLTIQEQNGKLQMWCLCPRPNLEYNEPKTILVFGTGAEQDENINMDYISTVQHNGLVYHFFELKS